jgi:hypothetical protein
MHSSMRELYSCFFAEDYLRAGPRGNLAVTADEVGVQVRFDHVLDVQAVCRRLRQIFINIALRIDNRRLAKLNRAI